MYVLLAWVAAVPTQGATALAEITIPPGAVTTLDGHTSQWPGQLQARATILIIGFGRHSQNATTAWQKAVMVQLKHPPAVDFYDMAMIAEIPGFMRSFVVGRIRKIVPAVLKPNFVPLTENEDAWKKVAGYAPDAPDAAYVLLVDRSGKVHMSSHAAFTPAGFAQLGAAAKALAATP